MHLTKSIEFNDIKEYGVAKKTKENPELSAYSGIYKEER